VFFFTPHFLKSVSPKAKRADCLNFLEPSDDVAILQSGNTAALHNSRESISLQKCARRWSPSKDKSTKLKKRRRRKTYGTLALAIGPALDEPCQHGLDKFRRVCEQQEKKKEKNKTKK